MKPEDIYKDYADGVFKYLVSISGDPDLAEELTQETFLKAITHADSFDGSVKIFTWLCAIAKNAYISYLRKEKRRKNTAQTENYHEPDMLSGLGETEIYKAVHSLPEPFRELILLRIHTDMSFAQIGEIFGRGENWARVNFYRGKEKLKQILDDKEESK